MGRRSEARGGYSTAPLATGVERMRIRIITPAGPRSRSGNRVTAVRWGRILRGLGHRVVIARAYRREPCDLLIALHARRSAASIRAFRRLHPDRPAVLALTGTDVYNDIHSSERARQALEIATRIVVLQPLAHRELPARLRPRVETIYQSASPTPAPPPPSRRSFDVAVVGHLRPVKDPFRAALAARGAPADSRLRILQAGAALSAAMDRRARREEARNPRYQWLGELPRWKARRLIAGSRVLVLSSLTEGGAHVISEAVVDGVPVLASRIPGSVGLLGRDYPGYFPVRGTVALRRLLVRCEKDPTFLAELRRRCRARAALFDPARERAAWKHLLGVIRYEVKS